MSNNQKDILALLNKILTRLDKIEKTINSPKPANVNRLKPRLRVIEDDKE